MDLATAQGRLNKGYGRFASKIGRPCAHYRPQTANHPISTANYEGSVSAYMDPRPTFSARKITKLGDPVWYGAFDATNVQPGDFLVSEKGTFFVAVMQDLLPPEVVDCNAILSIYRPTAELPTDPTRYRGGNTANGGKGAPLALNWPASVLEGTKGDRGILNLPNDTKSPWFDILLPFMPGVDPQTTDQFFDEQGRRYLISSPELTRHGWRFTAGRSEA